LSVNDTLNEVEKNNKKIAIILAILFACLILADYAVITSTYEKFYKWIEEQGKKITGPVREVYLNDPNEVGMEEALTEIYAPIE